MLMPTDPPNDSAFQFPCDFPVKAMGRSSELLATIVLDIVHRHAPDTRAETLRHRPSANGKYTSITITVKARSRKQLDAIYLDLNASEYIVMTL
jgi:putative lipoic acid-binding regulatory protein